MAQTTSPRQENRLYWIRNKREAVECLTSKERVRLALDHQEPDRVPIDLWVTSEVRDDLEAFFDRDYETILEALGVDFRVHRGPSYVGLEMKQYPDGTVSDLWGVRRISVEYEAGDRKGTYKELYQSPLAGMTSCTEIDSYQGWPSPDWWDYSQIADECRKHKDKCVVYAGDRLDRTAQLKTAMYLRGVEQIMMDLAQNPKIVDCIIDHVTEYYLAYNEKVFTAADGEIDIFMMGDDFGSQAGPLMSVKMWERYFEKGFRKFIDQAHRYGLKVMHHTCGSVEPFIPKFIDAGLDILQSLQPRAANMNLRDLKQKYGKYISFHGSIDIQHSMTFGNPSDIQEEVRERMAAGKQGGGFIICTAHNLQRDVPIENIFTLLEAYHEFGVY